MKFKSHFALSVLSIAVMYGCGCMEQYNPFPFWQKLTDERNLANRELPKLTPEGKLPENLRTPEDVSQGTDSTVSHEGAVANEAVQPAATAGEAPNKAEKKLAFDPQQVYGTFCVACHGPQGDLKLNNARDLTDPKWHAEATDAQIAAVIQYGAMEAGKHADFSSRSEAYKVSNPLMTPWGPIIIPAASSEEEKKQMLDMMVQYVRSLKK